MTKNIEKIFLRIIENIIEFSNDENFYVELNTEKYNNGETKDKYYIKSFFKKENTIEFIIELEENKAIIKINKSNNGFLTITGTYHLNDKSYEDQQISGDGTIEIPLSKKVYNKFKNELYKKHLKYKEKRLKLFENKIYEILNIPRKTKIKNILN